MAYEKKIEPLSRLEVYLSAFALQFWIIFFNFLPWGMIGIDPDCVEIYYNADIDDASDMESVHTCLKDHRGEILAGASCLLLSFPCIIAFIHYNYRINETLLAFLNAGYIQSLSAASWMVIACLGAAIVPALGIFIVYYDWEFAEGYQYFGYVMQYQMLRYMLLIVDSGNIAVGMAAGLPWLYVIFAMFGWFESAHYKMTREDQVKLVGMFGNLDQCGRGCGRMGITIVATFVILFCIFGAIGNTFDFAATGFFSYSGGSQLLHWIILVSFQLQVIQRIVLGCKLDTRKEFIDNSVQAL